MQQPPPMIPVMPSFPHTNITTDQIQKYLDENKKLILAILDNQNLGKLAECAQYQAQLQKNLMYLAAIADAQPQAPAMPPQMAPHPAMQQGGFYMQHPQAAAMAQQPGIFPQKVPLQFNSPHPMQVQQHQHLHQQHQSIQGQIGMQTGGANNGSHPQHSEPIVPGSNNGGDVRGGNKQDAPDTGATVADGEGNSATGDVRDGESSFMKGSEKAK